MPNVRALIAAGKTIDAIRLLREEEGLSLPDAKHRLDELAQSK
jgi:ribosomal protein L7/L12